MLKVFLAVLTNYLFHTSLLLEVVILSLVQPIFRIPVLLVVHVFTDIQNTEQQMWTESHKNSNLVNYTKAPWLHEREKTFKSAPREQVNGQTKACKEKLDDVLVFNDCVILVIIYEKLIFLAK